MRRMESTDDKILLTWLSGKFDDVTMEQVLNSDDMQLKAAMRFETECALCSDYRNCRHSKAILVPCEVISDGKRQKFITRAKICDKPTIQEAMWSKEKTLIPQTMWNMTFDNFKSDFAPTPRGKQRLVYFRDRISALCDKNFGVIIGGNVGAGKTHLAVAYGLKAIGKGKSVLFYTVPALFDALRKDYDLLEVLQNIDVLILDDIGTERSTDWTDERLFMLVDSRTANRKPIVITTNAHTINELQMLITVEGQFGRGERIISRLQAHTRAFWLNEEADYRNSPEGHQTWMTEYSNY